MKKIKTCPSGLRVIVHPMKSTRVVASGVFVGVGSAYETKELSGISHFIEHMLFKGTSNRSAFTIANDMESIGAQINAFTSRDCTAYYTISTDEHVEKSFEILSDIFFNSLFSEENMKNEKGVVIEEINMCNDDPTDICHDQLNLAHFGFTGLGRPILGTIDNVKSFTPEKLREHMGKYYCSDNVVISVAGNIDAQKVQEYIDKYFDSQFDCRVSQKRYLSPKKFNRRFLKTVKPNEQVNIAFGFPSYKLADSRIPSLYLMGNILGGGMSSRLFQKLREENGLVYDVYATDNEYTKTGMFMIYLAAKPESAERAIRGVKEVLLDIKKNGITPEELQKGKEQLKSSLVFGAEKAVSIMRSNGMRVLISNRVFDINKKLKQIDDITMESVKGVIEDVLNFDNASCSYVGKETEFDPLLYLRTNA